MYSIARATTRRGAARRDATSRRGLLFNLSAKSYSTPAALANKSNIYAARFYTKRERAQNRWPARADSVVRARVKSSSPRDDEYPDNNGVENSRSRLTRAAPSTFFPARTQRRTREALDQLAGYSAENTKGERVFGSNVSERPPRYTPASMVDFMWALIRIFALAASRLRPRAHRQIELWTLRTRDTLIVWQAFAGETVTGYEILSPSVRVPASRFYKGTR